MKLSLCPLLPVAIGFIVGIVVQCCGLGLWGLAISIAVGTIMWKTHGVAWTVLLYSLAAGIVTSWAHQPFVPRLEHSASREYSGIIDEKKELDGGQMLIVTIDSCYNRSTQKFSAKLFIPSVLPECDDTDRIRFRARLQELKYCPDLPMETDFDQSLRLRGVRLMAILPSDSILSHTPRTGLYPSMRHLRHDIKHHIAYSPIADRTSAFLIAIFTGDHDLLSAESVDVFKTSGLAHILALSGLHTGFITLCIAFLLMPLTMARQRKIKFLLTIPLLWLFALTTGMTPSVTRAVIMASVFLITLVVEREAAPMNALCLAVVGLLLFDPLSIYSVSFQLSFLATVSIIIFYPFLTDYKPGHPFIRTLQAFLAVTVAATLGTVVVVAYHFGQIPIWTIPANMLISFLLPALMGGGIILTAASACGIRLNLLGRCMDGLYDMIEAIATGFSSIGHSVDSTGSFPATLVIAYFGVLTSMAIWAYTKRSVWLLSSGAIVLFALTISFIGGKAADPDGELYVVRQSGQTTIFVRENNEMKGLTTAKPHLCSEIRAAGEKRYQRYMAQHHIDSIPVQTLSLPTYIEFKGKRLLITDRDVLQVDGDGKIDYLLICRGFRGNVSELANKMKADSVIICVDLHPMLHDRYLSELLDGGISSRSLKEAPVIVK
ncbi:MAG: ComEC/Rec2 family competence protein [Muribaculaceae bacterium]|nr:ComEC/Rec2 family competence protein [Muribaculaceae bacterium]